MQILELLNRKSSGFGSASIKNSGYVSWFAKNKDESETLLLGRLRHTFSKIFFCMSRVKRYSGWLPPCMFCHQAFTSSKDILVYHYIQYLATKPSPSQEIS
jgi:hypothetical protein